MKKVKIILINFAPMARTEILYELNFLSFVEGIRNNSENVILVLHEFVIYMIVT